MEAPVYQPTDFEAGDEPIYVRRGCEPRIRISITLTGDEIEPVLSLAEARGLRLAELVKQALEA